jgi:hypothetical protein
VLREVLPSQEFAVQCGVNVLSNWAVVPEHILYSVLETDSYDSVVKYLEPILRVGTARVTPVVSFKEAVGMVGR